MITVFGFGNGYGSRRLKRVAIMAEEFLLGLLAPVEGKENDYIYGFRFEDRYGEFPPDTRVEAFSFEYNPLCFMVLLSCPSWSEVELGEYAPLVQSKLGVSKAFINKEHYARIEDTLTIAKDEIADIEYNISIGQATLADLHKIRDRINTIIYDKEKG